MTQQQALAMLRDDSMWVARKPVEAMKGAPTGNSVSADNAEYYDKHLKGSIGC